MMLEGFGVSDPISPSFRDSCLQQFVQGSRATSSHSNLWGKGAFQSVPLLNKPDVFLWELCFVCACCLDLSKVVSCEGLSRGTLLRHCQCTAPVVHCLPLRLSASTFH